MNVHGKDEKVLKRFGLRNQQFFAGYRLKNLHWFLDGKRIGFGDLRESDIRRIQSRLGGNNEVFTGFNEHHMSSWMRRENPMVVINAVTVDFPKAIPVRETTRDKIRGLYPSSF